MSIAGLNPHIIIQARSNSKRLPGKAFLEILGKPILEHVVEACQWSGCPVGVATPDTDTEIQRWCLRHGVKLWIGSEHNVLERFYEAATIWKANPAVRITADCPVLNSKLIRETVNTFERFWVDGMPPDRPGMPRQSPMIVAVSAGEGAVGYRRWPDGWDCEAIAWLALNEAHHNATSSYDREHVTPYIWRSHPDRIWRIEPDTDRGDEKLSIDTMDDYLRIRAGIESDAS